jgi:hypothetical protein
MLLHLHTLFDDGQHCPPYLLGGNKAPQNDGAQFEEIAAQPYDHKWAVEFVFAQGEKIASKSTCGRHKFWYTS